MKKLESSLKNMLLVLTSVTVIAVGLLAYVNELTKEPIAQANLKTLNDALGNVVPQFDNNPVAEADTLYNKDDARKIDFIVYPARRGETLVGTAVQSTSLGFGGDLTVLVGFDTDGNIYDYSLLAHTETPGLGSKADVWFKKGEKGEIIGMNPGKEELMVKKDGKGQVDAITASTITTNAFLKAVNNAFKAYKSGADANTNAPSTPANDVATAQESNPETINN